MWTKDIYEEQMLAYLGEVEADLGQFAHARLQQNNLKELYVDFDVAVKRLWWLIDAGDEDWEGFRHPLEISCDWLQRAFYRLPRLDALRVSTGVRIAAQHESRVELWETIEVL
jgi:hypothetical protein